MADEFSPVAILGITLGATLLFAVFLLVIFVYLYKRKSHRNSAIFEERGSHLRKQSAKKPVRDVYFRRSDESAFRPVSKESMVRPVSNDSRESFIINPVHLTTYLDTGRDTNTRSIVDNRDVPKRQSLERSGQGNSTRYSSDPTGRESLPTDSGSRMVSMISGDSYIYSTPIKTNPARTHDSYNSQTMLIQDDSHRYSFRAPAPDPTQRPATHIVYTTDPEPHYQSVHLTTDPTAGPGPISTVLHPGSSASLDRKAWMTSSQGGYRGSAVLQ